MDDYIAYLLREDRRKDCLFERMRNDLEHLRGRYDFRADFMAGLEWELDEYIDSIAPKYPLITSCQSSSDSIAPKYPLITSCQSSSDSIAPKYPLITSCQSSSDRSNQTLAAS